MPWIKDDVSLHYVPPEVTVDGKTYTGPEVTDELLARAGWVFENEEIIQDPNTIRILMGDV
jgi:hypothetical protein